MKSGSGRTAGFTLIEVVVVMVLIGIAAGIVGPALAGRIETFSFDSDASRLVAQLRLLQIRAREDQQTTIAVCQDDEIVVFRGGSIIQRRNLSGSLRFSTPASYVFSPAGQIAGPATLDITNNRSLAGQVLFGPLPGMLRFTRRRIEAGT